MTKIPAEKAVEMFEEIIGWPYVSPGTCDDRGIDCSGAWVRVYRGFGLKIDHGSNSQYRRFCDQTGKIQSTEGLCKGMAVFKVRNWKEDQVSHRDYQKAPGDVYHVGCVTSTDPLRIVHATPEYAKADREIGNWALWGQMKQVDYSGTAGQESLLEPNIHAQKADPGPGQAVVATISSGLRLRKSPGKDGTVIRELPPGTVVQVQRVQGAWANVRWDIRPGLYHIGWCCIGEEDTEYLKFG